MQEAYIVSAVRTPVGKFGGALKNVAAPQLGAIAIRAALERCGVAPAEVQEVIMGNVVQAGLGQNPARQASVAAGVPVEVPSYTVNKVCGSGLKSVVLAAQSIALSEAEIVVAGGMENMSAAPFLLRNARWGYRLGNGELVDAMVYDGLWEVFKDYHMGMTAENLAAEFGISRDEQDAFAVASQAKTAAAVEAGFFRDEIVPVSAPQGKEPVIQLDKDEHPRPGTTLKTLANLKPAFKPDGTVTAGNASGINDAAAAVVVMSVHEMKRRRLEPLGRIVGYATVGLDPARMGLGPVGAASRALQKAGLSIADMDLVEINEAFAVQTLAVMRELRIDADRLNVHGGAIALGHPIGASGTRIVVTLLHAMRRRRSRRGLATLCVGGGQGIALIVERNE